MCNTNQNGRQRRERVRSLDSRPFFGGENVSKIILYTGYRAGAEGSDIETMQIRMLCIPNSHCIFCEQIDIRTAI